MKTESFPFLEYVTGFTEVSDPEKDKMFEIMNFSTHERNEVLFKEGEVCEKIAFIIEGTVCVYHTDEKGEQHPFNFLFEYHPLGDYHSFEQQVPAGFSAVTLEPTTIIWSDYNNFFGFMKSFPKYEAAMTKALSKELFLKNEHLKILRLDSARERYEALCQTRPEILKRIPLKHVAAYLGMALETLSRVRAVK